MFYLGLFLATFLSLTSFLPLLRSRHWLIRDLDFPRFQVFILNGLLLALFLLFGQPSPLLWLLVAFVLIAWLFDFYRIYPYLPFKKKTVEKSQNLDLSILTANIRTKNRKYDRLIDLVTKKDPDMVLLIEVDEKWVHNISPLIEKYPYRIIKPMENTYGLVLLSKKSLEREQILFRVDDDVPSIKTIIKDSKWGKVEFYGLHPRPPRPSEAHSTQRDAELMQVADEISKTTRPCLVLGDLNDVAWSHTTRLFLRTSGLLDPRHGRGFFNSFPAFWPRIGFPLDHIFISPRFRLKSFDVLEDIGSDHRPLMIELAYGEYPQESGEEADQEDEAEKNEAIKKGRQWDGPFKEVDPEE